MSNNTEGKVVITGMSRGLGKEIARLLYVQQDASVVLSRCLRYVLTKLNRRTLHWLAPPTPYQQVLTAPLFHCTASKQACRFFHCKSDRRHQIAVYFRPPKDGAVKSKPSRSGKSSQGERFFGRANFTRMVVQTMIGLEPNQRNRALLKLLYIAGLRVSPLTQLQWFSLQPRDVGGQVLV